MDGKSVGTPAYLFLEQVRGQPLTLASGVSSFAVLLHEALTGRPVFRRSNVPDTLKTASS